MITRQLDGLGAALFKRKSNWIANFLPDKYRIILLLYGNIGNPIITVPWSEIAPFSESKVSYFDNEMDTALCGLVSLYKEFFSFTSCGFICMRVCVCALGSMFTCASISM